MKKKVLGTKLSLNKKTIVQLTDAAASNMLGGNTGANASICPCIPPTEPVGCSNGCPIPTLAVDKASHCCPQTTEPPLSTWCQTA